MLEDPGVGVAEGVLSSQPRGKKTGGSQSRRRSFHRLNYALSSSGGEAKRAAAGSHPGCVPDEEVRKRALLNKSRRVPTVEGKKGRTAAAAVAPVVAERKGSFCFTPSKGKSPSPSPPVSRTSFPVTSLTAAEQCAGRSLSSLLTKGIPLWTLMDWSPSPALTPLRKEGKKKRASRQNRGGCCDAVTRLKQQTRV